ncbi:MAG: AAA family ATPase [Rhodomicrobium sp.]
MKAEGNGYDGFDPADALVTRGSTCVRDIMLNPTPYNPKEPFSAQTPSTRVIHPPTFTHGHDSKANGAHDASNLVEFRFDANAVPRPLRYIIKDLCPREGTGLAGGKSGAGKSFIAIDLAVAIASGGQFFGRQVRETLGVVYLAAEGGGGIENRIFAAKRKRDLTAPLPIAFSSAIGDLSDDKEIDNLINKLKRIDRHFLDRFKVPIGVVIVDTMSAAFRMKDENSNAEGAATCQRLAKISSELKAAAMGVHHYGKGSDAELRGASAFRANVDFVLGVLGERDNQTGKVTGRSLIVAKHRDGEEGPISNFELKFVELGVDDYGDPFGSCAVEPTGLLQTALERPKKPNAANDTFHAAFNEVAISSARKHLVNGKGPQVQAVKVELVRNEFYRRYVTGDEDGKAAAKRRSAFNRALNQLRNGRPYYTEVEDGVEWIWQ